MKTRLCTNHAVSRKSCHNEGCTPQLMPFVQQNEHIKPAMHGCLGRMWKHASSVAATVIACSDDHSSVCGQYCRWRSLVVGLTKVLWGLPNFLWDNTPTQQMHARHIQSLRSSLPPRWAVNKQATLPTCHTRDQRAFTRHCYHFAALLSWAPGLRRQARYLQARPRDAPDSTP